jgi:hypothetical protein
MLPKGEMTMSNSVSLSNIPTNIRNALTNAQIATNALDAQYGNKDDKLQRGEFAKGIVGSTGLSESAGQAAANHLLALESRNSFSGSTGTDVISRKALAAYHLTIWQVGGGDSAAFNRKLASGDSSVLSVLSSNYDKVLQATGSASVNPSRSLETDERTALDNSLTWTAGAQGKNGDVSLQRYIAAFIGNTGASRETAEKAANIVDQNKDGRTDLVEIMAKKLAAYKNKGQFNSKAFSLELAEGKHTQDVKDMYTKLMAYFKSPY